MIAACSPGYTVPLCTAMPEVGLVVQQLIEVALVDELAALGAHALGSQLPRQHRRRADPDEPLEDAAHDCGVGVDHHELPVLYLVAERHVAAHEHALPPRRPDLVADAFGGDLALELGEAEQDVEREPPHRGGGIERLAPGAIVEIDGERVEVDGALQIASDMPATYRVEIDAFPYRFFTAEIVSDMSLLVIRKDIAGLRKAGIAEANRLVGAVRASFVTVIPAQDMVYLEKAGEARRFLVAYPTPADVPETVDADPVLGFPFVLAEVGITASTAWDVAVVYVTGAATFRAAGAALETVRLGTVAAIEVAETPAAIDAALTGCAASLALVPVPRAVPVDRRLRR